MHLYICIDDTDSKTSEKGTGAIAEELMEMVAERFGAKTTYITRHQLLIHPDVPYTSHNSSMCFECDVSEEYYDQLIKDCFDHLQIESAEGSDPGLCVADAAKMDTDLLVRWGKECKRKVVTIKAAYETAEKAGVYLNEAGGTGQGVIGAVAGIGLRYWGNDGTLKGKPKDIEGNHRYTAGELRATSLIEDVVDMQDNQIPDGDAVYLEKKPKISLVGGKLAVIVEKQDESGVWQLLAKNKARWHGGDLIFKEGCSEYKRDVEEECVSADDNNCYNCLYRRWLEDGILCQRPLEDKQ